MTDQPSNVPPAVAEPIDQPMLIAGVAALDTILVIVAALAAAALSPSSTVFSPLFFGAAMSGVVLFALQKAWSYTIPALGHVVRQTAKVALGLGSAFAALLAVVYVFGLEAEAPRPFLLIWACLTFGLMVACRAALAWRIARWIAEGRLVRRAVIVGGGRPAEELIRQLRRSTSAGIKICGVFDDRAKDRSADPVERIACSARSRRWRASAAMRRST